MIEFDDYEDYELADLEHQVRNERRKRAVAQLKEFPPLTKFEFDLMKKNPTEAMYAYRCRTSLPYHATGGVFAKLYGVQVF